MTEPDWTPTARELPTPGVEVLAMQPSGHVTRLVYDRLWWFPDRSMYVYYVPTYWRLP